jgi:hypothetical protein
MRTHVKSASRRQREPYKHDNSLPGRNASAVKRDLSSCFSWHFDLDDKAAPPQGELKSAG